MKKIMLVMLVGLLVLPSFVYAAPSPGIKSSNPFYFIDTGFEKLNLLITFNPEKKAKKALQYAEERLAEAEVAANENKPNAVEKAIKNYESNISLATEKSKELKSESETESLLNTISSNTHQHQEVLRSVYNKVPEEAKEAILKAIEVSQKRQEEADRQIGVLKKEVAQLQDKIGELKEKLEERSAEQKPSPTLIQKTNNEIKKSAQTPPHPTVTPLPDKSLKELKEELERKLKELEKTPTPIPVVSTSPAYTFNPTSTPTNPTSTPTSLPSTTTNPTPTTTLTPIPTPTSTPTPTPLLSPSVAPSSNPSPTPLPTSASLVLREIGSLNEARSTLEGSFDTMTILGVTAKDSKVTIKSIGVTFLNDDTTARLRNVGVNGANEIPAVEPGMSYTFTRSDIIGSYQNGQLVYPDSTIRFSAWGHTKDGNVYSGPNVIGWQIRINSLTAVITDNPTISATVVGLPMTLSSIPRDASISLVSNSPSGLQSQTLSIATILKLKVKTTYPDIKITSLKVKVVGKSVSSNQTESITENFSPTDSNWKSLTSGVSAIIPASIRVGAGGSGYPNGEINFLVDVNNETFPGTSWQLTLEEATALDNSGRPISILGLPIVGHEIHW